MNGTWGIILGASSGMGLASAKKLANSGMNLILVHRDRRSVMDVVNKEFEQIGNKVETICFNTDALVADKREALLEEVLNEIGESKVHVLLHSVAKGNLKKMNHGEGKVPERESEIEKQFKKLKHLGSEVNYGNQVLNELDFTLTTQSMATSMLSWTQALLTRNLFTPTARVIGLTSEGHERIWPGYGAVAVAKSSLETLAKYMAVEFASAGLRTNVIQAGITSTPSMEMIPGSELMKSSAKYRNPLGRLTQTEDIANAVYLLCRPEANWINGTRLVVDGGEHLM